MNDNIEKVSKKSDLKEDIFVKRMIEEVIAFLDNRDSINLDNKEEAFKQVIVQIETFMNKEEIKSNGKVTGELEMLLERLNKDATENEQDQNDENLFSQVYESYIRKQQNNKIKEMQTVQRIQDEEKRKEIQRKEQELTIREKEYNEKQHKRISELQEKSNKFNKMMQKSMEKIPIEDFKGKKQNEEKLVSKIRLKVIGMYKGELGKQAPKEIKGKDEGPEL